MSATKPEIGSSLARVEPASVAVDYSRELEGARMLMKSGLLPDSLKSPEAAMFVILTGRDLGLSPVQSLRSINVIKGKIEVAADMQLGLFHRAGGKSHWKVLTNTEAVLRLAAPWLLEPHEESFTMEDAKRAGLTNASRSGEPSMFTKFPRPMLRSRAITAGLKSIGFDPTAGMYAAGEIGGPEMPEVAIQAEEEEIAKAFGTANEPMADAADDDPDDVAATALRGIEALLPTLTGKQQDWIRERLSVGVDPVELFDGLQSKVGAKAVGA